MSSPIAYHPRTFKPLTFRDAIPRFLKGSDTPRDYLERCLATIEEREPVIKGWTSLRIDGARVDADASNARYRAGRPLSSIDGMPVGIKDLIETRDMPTTLGLRGFAINSGRDSPSIRALRDAGAIILGKTVTTELGGGTLSATTNPFDSRCTAGGSSSGSAAVVGARMVPVALGTQVSGSLIRPASYCANVALRPSLGGILRGERSHYSHGVIGVHAGSLEDMWRTAIEIAKRTGGDPGYSGLHGDDALAPPIQPRRLGVLETEGWATIDELTRSALDSVLARLGNSGTKLIGRREDPFLDALDRAIASATALNADILAWENRWVYEHLVETMPERLSPWTLRIVKRGRAMRVDDYRVALAQREAARRAMAALSSRVDALITLASPGSAPPLEIPADGGDARIAYGTTGRSTFNIATSLLGVPAITLPLTALRGMPMGVQIIGQRGEDERICALANWVTEHVEPVVL